MIFKFIEIENEGHKIPLFFGKKGKYSQDYEKNYKDKIESIRNKIWNGNGKIDRFLKKFNFKKSKEFTVDKNLSIKIYKTCNLEFSIITVKRTSDVYELLDYIKKDKVLESLISKQGNKTTYYILEER
ncbi:hypothetical protein [Leptotrichia sp.]|jgi:hypothetical protein|uniref:hypothetical protein n=1 Tax=Leptotrichia sp. TaxID=104608 RepID=UPI0017F9674F|nr:hypothetical protein [Leptotrichia sp.]MBB1534206.1 hypothetical protein [Leptotrichia sp.]